MSNKNIFAKFQDYVNKPKRNVFDLSFANNLTTKFGQLTPVFCKECIPGDSFKIHSKFALQFMPMKFPIQTPMKAYLHFFYVRNRNLYKDWMDFIGKTKDNLTLPYVQPTDKKKFFRVGGLADYLGVPNVIYQGVETTYGLSTMSDYNVSTNYSTTSNPAYPYALKVPTSTKPMVVKDEIFNFLDSRSFEEDENGVNFAYSYEGDLTEDNIFYADNAACCTAVTASSSKAVWYRMVSIACDTSSLQSLNMHFYNNDAHYTDDSVQYRTFIIMGKDDSGNYVTLPWAVQATGEVPSGQSRQRFELSLDGTAAAVLKNSGATSIDIFTYYNTSGAYAYFAMMHNTYGDDDFRNPLLTIVNVTASDEQSTIVVGDTGFEDTPYDSDIHLNALPFRAYEAIYNSYYRNAQNNPYILDGVAEYNKYIPTYDGGADVTQYDLHQRNWEYDFLTSSVQTPQQGDIAPLVGISVTGEATFQDDEGNVYYASAQYDSDGNITGWTSHSPNMPQGSLRLLMDMAGTGISINDLRNVNAFQKFLENNIRRGLKYRDQIKSHFGVDVRYDELDMPEFIGGCSTVVNINKLSQTSESGSTPLGSFVGQGSAYGESKHDITHYCDEHGFIIGILSVVPVPVYSQLLPKFFLKSEQLDYYFPEFGHIGYQPILQKEVSPLQTYYSEGNLNKVFGYQRSWYDYLDSVDEVHAQFRTTMRDFIMNRTFLGEPELGEDFLLVDPDQLNDVFLAGTDDSDLYDSASDKIIGSMYFEVSKKSPIPLFGIPKLD